MTPTCRLLPRPSRRHQTRRQIPPLISLPRSKPARHRFTLLLLNLPSRTIHLLSTLPPSQRLPHPFRTYISNHTRLSHYLVHPTIIPSFQRHPSTHQLILPQIYPINRNITAYLTHPFIIRSSPPLHLINFLLNRLPSLILITPCPLHNTHPPHLSYPIPPSHIRTPPPSQPYLKVTVWRLFPLGRPLLNSLPQATVALPRRRHHVHTALFVADVHS